MLHARPWLGLALSLLTVAGCDDAASAPDAADAGAETDAHEQATEGQSHADTTNDADELGSAAPGAPSTSEGSTGSGSVSPPDGAGGMQGDNGAGGVGGAADDPSSADDGPSADDPGSADDSEDAREDDAADTANPRPEDDTSAGDPAAELDDAGVPFPPNPQAELDGGGALVSDTGGPATDLGEANCDSDALSYDQRVLCDAPVGYWALTGSGEEETDLTGNGHGGRYQGNAPGTSALPNGQSAADFDGESQYLSIDSDPSFSIPTTGELTWEAWIQPAVVNFPNVSNGYVDWMGKCEDYAPTCEWEARVYNADSDRCNRLSAYAFNPGADLGSGAYFEADCGSVQPRDWLHVVGQYTLLWEPEGCADAEQYPGSIEIWVNGVNWNQSQHGQTGCMSQYGIEPEANDSPINVGTMAGDAWFQGAIGKLAIYDYLLDAEQIAAHYRQMTGLEPSGNCEDSCSL